MINYVRNVRGGGRALLGEEKEVTVALLEGMTGAMLGEKRREWLELRRR